MKQENKERHQSSQKKLNHFSDLNLYGQNKQALIKKIQTLIHELKIYHRMEEDINDKDSKIEIKNLAEMKIIIDSYKHNQEVLNRKVDFLEKSQIEMKEIILDKEKKIEVLMKEVSIYKKKSQQLDKMGGKHKISKLEEEKIKYFKDIQDLKSENLMFRKQIQQLSNKCKILEDLNKQTESKLVEKLLFKQQKTPLSESHLKSEIEEDKENDIKLDNILQVKNQKIQLFSLKEQLRELREQLNISQQTKNDLKLKIQERQMFYAKMMSMKK